MPVFGLIRNCAAQSSLPFFATKAPAFLSTLAFSAVLGRTEMLPCEVRALASHAYTLSSNGYRSPANTKTDCGSVLRALDVRGALIACPVSVATVLPRRRRKQMQLRVDLCRQASQKNRTHS